MCYIFVIVKTLPLALRFLIWQTLLIEVVLTFLHAIYFFCLAGVHVMLKTSSLGVRYALYSLASSKPEPGGTMPKVCAAFLSQPGARDIKLYPTGDVRINNFDVGC